MRILVVGLGLERDRLVAVLDRELGVLLPPLAVLVVPARVLVLEPLEVVVVHRVDAPVVGEPARREELGDLVDVALVPDPVPGLLDQIVRDRQAVLLQRDQVGPVVVVVDPAPPGLRVGLAVLAAVLGAVLDERADGGVHDGVVVPPGVAQVALEQLAVALVRERHEDDRVAVGDVAALVGLHRVEDRRQQVVAVGRGLARHRDEEDVGERRLGDDRQVDVGGGDRVTGDEALAELAADRAGVAVREPLLGQVEAGRIDVVVHVEPLEVHLDRRVTDLVDHLNREAVVDLRIRNRVDGQRHRAGGGDLRERDDAQEELLPLHPALLDLAEHVAADRAVHRAEHAIVLLLLHREVGAQDLLERVLLRCLLERVVGRVLVDRLHERRFPGQLLDLLVSLRDARSAHECSLL